MAIATALNAADTLTKTLDQALESERAKTMVRAADNAARMIAVVGKNAVSGVAGTVTGPTEAPSDDNLRPETVMGSAGRAVAAASVVESAEEAMAGFEEEEEEQEVSADDTMQFVCCTFPSHHFPSSSPSYHPHHPPASLLPPPSFHSGFLRLEGPSAFVYLAFLVPMALTCRILMIGLLQIDDVDSPATSCLVVFSVDKEIPDGLCLKVR